jgi:hypothetical protein
MRFDAQVVTDFQGGGVKEGEAGAAPEAGGEKGGQGQQGFRFHLHTARITDALRKGAGEMDADMVEVERLEMPKTGGLEEDQNRHHFAPTQCGVSDAVLLPLGDLRGLNARKELPTELVAIIEEAQHVHETLLEGEGFLLKHRLPHASHPQKEC